MKRVGLIERFILPHYETLHTGSRENLAGVLVECLNNWEQTYRIISDEEIAQCIPLEESRRRLTEKIYNFYHPEA